MSTVRSVSSAAVFKTLTDLAKSSSSSNGTKVTATELKAALDSFSWGDFKVTKAEVLAAKMVVENLPAGTLSAPAKAEYDAWVAANKDATGGLFYERAAVAFQQVESFVRWNDGSQSGSKLTPAEATALVSVLGDKPSPARISQVMRTRNEAVSAGQVSTTARKVLDSWLAAHPLKAPEGKLGTDLAAASNGLWWTSETDRVVQPIEMDAPAGTMTATKLRTLLGEPTATPVEIRSLDEVFANQTEITADMGDDEKAIAQQWQRLHDALAGLTDVKVYRVGSIDIDVYIVGRAPNGKLAGVLTGVVET